MRLRPHAHDRLEELAIRIARHRMAAELELVASILGGVPEGIACAQQCGVTPALFEQEDLRLIYCACDVGRHLDKPQLLYLAKRALQDAGRWDAGARAFERGMNWSDASLASLADSYPSPAMVRHWSRRLRDLDRRLNRARQCWRRMMMLLEGAAGGEGVTR